MSAQDGNGSGEEDDDSSSLSMANISLHDNKQQQENSSQDALENFRQQWQRELESSPARRANRHANKQDEESTETESKEEKAKRLFVRGAESEKYGAMDEAVWCYRRALQLVPDIELRLHHMNTLHKHESKESLLDNEIEDTALREERSDNDHEDEEDGELMLKFQKIIAKEGKSCIPELEVKGCHISLLPMEVFLLVLRWVVGRELDVMSLVRVGKVCRAWYVISRDPQIWHALCLRTWGLNCGPLKGTPWSSWQQMYIERTRLRFHGCYISKTSYLRHGENSFQDTFYKPWYLVQYYRYLRFYPEGTVAMLTTAEEPAACVGLLKQRGFRTDLPILTGHYRLVGNKVIIVLKKHSADKKSSQASHSRFKSRRNQVSEQSQQTYHLELQVCGHKSRRNAQLIWTGYKVTVMNKNGTGSSSNFDVTPPRFAPFWFSLVRSYHASSEAPLV